MKEPWRPLTFLLLLILFSSLLAACDTGSSDDEGIAARDVETDAVPSALSVPTGSRRTAPPVEGGLDKWALWVDGPHLRGANIWQAVVIPELDGLEFKGSGPVGPPYSQEDLDRLAALGANYVSISGPGLFTETPPYTLDPEIEAHLDSLLAMIAKADMFATIGFRTGPGRSEFSLCCGEDPYFEGYFNDSVWEDQAAQAAWMEMWRHTAEHYRGNPTVVGYKLMVEPNAAGVLLNLYDPEEFYADYADTLYDWNQLYPRIVTAIRQVDPETPILVGGMGWSGVAWLPYLEPTGDSRTVYVVHQYEPQDQYTHQEPGSRNTYPGQFDTDYDGKDDRFDRVWLEDLLSTVDRFVATHHMPVAVDEYGVNRWVPGAAEFMDAQMSLFEQRGMNYALWEWQTSWEPFAEDVHDMDFRLGPDPENRTGVRQNDLLDVILEYWSRNTVRPSTFTESEGPTASLTTEAAEDLPTPSTAPGVLSAEKWDLWTGGAHLRGMDMHPCRLFTADGCAQLVTRQDVQDLRNLGANLIHASYPGVFAQEPPYQVDPTALRYLDDLIGWAEEAGIYVVIHFRTGPGRNEAAIVLEGDPLSEVWHDQTAHEAWIEMWRFTAERFRDAPVVIGYDLMVEPHPNTLIDPDWELGPREVQARAQGTLLDWNAFAAEMTAAIREVDPVTPIIVSSLDWASAEWFEVLEPTGDPRTVYSLHAYDPDVYTSQDEGDDTYHYPDIVDDYGETITFDRGWLEENYHPVLEFAKQHNVPIYVGEFGALRWVPDAATFLYDQTDLFEQYGWSYAAYVWRGDEPDFDGFNLEYGPDPDNHAPDPGNPLLGLFRQLWAQNQHFPTLDASGAELLAFEPEEPLAGPRTGLPTLADVRHWLYLIDIDLEPETVDQIAASTHDMVVLDFIPSEENNTDYPMAEVVARLRDAPHPKLVMAYIDVGQAEDYRTYWRPGWEIGDPEWIAGGDPDGWEGNYPVAYWHDEYRDIWLGPDGYLQAILDAGFDGVYLDWLEAYSDEHVVALAESEGLDPVQEMIWWVGDIAAFGRAQDPDFVVIAQNAAELASDDEYVRNIDAIAQEQVWFDGGADNDPPGDCPLPLTEAEVDTKAYRDTLSRACRRQYDRYPESTLHMSSEEYLRDLMRAQAKGLIIFTVDYALNAENVAQVYETSRDLGFVPFVSSRALDRFLPPVP